MANSSAYLLPRIFTGTKWLYDYAIVITGGKTDAVIPADELPAGVKRKEIKTGFAAPAFIDLQIYGAYGKLLAVYPQADALYKLNEYCYKSGTAFCLPTVATNTKEVFYQCIDAVKEYWQQDGKGILGLHLEGPWINPVKRGAHIESLIHSPTIQEAKELLEYGKGIIKMITLAPEVCSNEVIDLLLSYNIIISAGHSNATYKEAMASFDKGITTVTHLYNAMSALQHRAPGLTGATMDHSTVFSSIIPDGHHVDYAALRIAKKAMGERLFAITDAVTETGEGYYPHQLAGDKYISNNILSGSALTMNKALQNLVNHAGIETGEALRMCSLYPAQVIQRENELGKIEPGHLANIILLDDELNVTGWLE
ncbi:MAG: N-acetylglucosamine-6-phosphate deacetylase [Bacteroidetes bacterium]|nr:N-acetylglucosamine-6-phosphate deacetylase [Bacteroidota bacterium]